MARRDILKFQTGPIRKPPKHDLTVQVCSYAAEMLIYVVITMKAMSSKKADLRLAQLGLHAEVTMNRKILYQPLYDPVAKPRTLPTAINSEKYAFATRFLR